MWLGEWGVLVSGPGSTWSFEAYEEVPAVGVCVTVAIVFSVCGCSERGLSLRLKPGDRFSLVHTVNTRIVTMVDEKSGALDKRAEWRFDMQVESVSEDGVSTLSVEIRNAKLGQWSNDGGGTRSLGDALGGEDVFAQYGKLLRKKSFKVKLGPLGGIRGVEGLDEIRREVNSRLVIGGEHALMPVTEEIRKKVRQSIMKPLDDFLMASRFNGLFHVLPPAASSVGDTWLNGEVPFPTYTAYETRSWSVESRENGVLTLSFSSTIRPEEQSGAFAVSGEEHGTVLVDETTGLMTAWESSAHLEGSSERRVAGDPSEVVHASMTVDIESRAEVSVVGRPDKAGEGARGGA